MTLPKGQLSNAPETEPYRPSSISTRIGSGLRNNALALFIVGFAIIAFYAVSRINYPLFHTSIEFITIAISVAIFLLVWKSRHILDNGYLVFIGVAFVFIAVIDFLHTVVYQGVGIIPGSGGALSTQLWVAARYLQAVTLLAAPLLIRKKPRFDTIAIIYLVADTIIVASIFVFGIFPATYAEGTGLTPFKIVSEYFISLLLIGAIVLLYRNRTSFDRQVFNNLVIAIALTIVSELMFSSYANVFDLFNTVGHFLRLISFYFFYRAIIEVGMEKPYNLLYRNLNESEKKYRALTDLSPDAIVVHRQGEILYTNQAGARLFGVPGTSDLTGKNILEFVHPDDKPAVIERMAAALDQHITTPSSEFRFIRNGEVVLVESTDGPFTWEGEPATQVIFRDITARKKSEDALREANQYLDNLIGYANAPIIVWDRDFRITRFNRAFERLTGRDAPDVVGQRLDILFPDETRDKSMALIRQTFRGDRWEVVEIPVLHLDGSVHTVLWNSATLYEKDGKTVLSTIAQGQDITEMKHHEEDLLKLTKELKRSNEELEQFAYIASHDLREPLRMVTSFSQLLEQRYKGKLDSDADEFIHYIVEGGTRMDALVNDLLEYSRITSHAKPFEPTDMNAVVRDVIRDLSVAVKESGAKIDVDILPKVSVDRLQLMQVFQNLVANAVKFRSGNAPEITIGAVREKEAWVFSVKDNGIGIDPEFSEKIFEIFQRLHSRSDYPGTGIGLAICRRIIERHGGRIWVESKGGEGSTFYFTIPADRENSK